MAEEGRAWRLLRILSIGWSLYRTFFLAQPILASTLTTTSFFVVPSGVAFYKVMIAPTELEQKLSTLQEQASTLEGQILALQGQVSTLEDKVPTLQESVSTLEDQVPTLERRVAAIADQVSKWGDLPSHGTGLLAQCKWEQSKIMPFDEGKHELDSDQQTRLDEPATKMRNNFEDDQTLQHLVLIGRADITPLRDQAHKDYGSNNGLAQARAKWVLDELKKELKKKLPEWEGDIAQTALLLSAGPLHAGKANANDRSVEVWACWVPKEPEQTSTSTEPAG